MEIKRPEPLQQISPDAKKVFSGVLHDVYQWPQKLFDGTTVTYERLTREDSAVIIPVTPEGKIVVLREQQPGTGWFATLPCGGINPGEAPEVAALRELKEETGYAPSQLDLWFSHQINSRMDWAVYVFIARDVKLEGKAENEAGERIETREVSLEEFLRIAAQDDFQNMDVTPRLLRAALDPAEMAALKKRLGI